MTFRITDDCTACGTCKDACPSEAINEGEEKYTIDPETCVECGVCVDACPTNAIVEE